MNIAGSLVCTEERRFSCMYRGEEVLFYVERRGGSLVCIEERRFSCMYRGEEVLLYV